MSGVTRGDDADGKTNDYNKSMNDPSTGANNDEEFNEMRIIELEDQRKETK